MKYLLFPSSLCAVFLLSQSVAFAGMTNPAEGDIRFYNASKHEVTAQVSTMGKFTLAANQSRNVPYSSLRQACSSTPTHCKADFYVNDTHAGSATLNAVSGKVLRMNLMMKVHTAKGPQQILRSVTIQ